MTAMARSAHFIYLLIYLISACLLLLFLEKRGHAVANVMLYFLACLQWHWKTHPFFKSRVLPRGQIDVAPVFRCLDTIFNNLVADSASTLVVFSKAIFSCFYEKVIHAELKRDTRNVSVWIFHLWGTVMVLGWGGVGEVQGQKCR